MSPLLDPPSLRGPWRLQREIEDRHAGQRLRVVGSLTLTDRDSRDPEDPADPGLDWAEAGTLHRPGADPVPVTRRLRVVRRDGGWWVLFEDGRDFHPWQPGAWVDHPCGADHYRGLVEGLEAGAWRITWEVQGPAKDYTMRTVLHPAAPGWLNAPP